MKKQNKGITLIALVITIIVLLILAAVTISTLTGDNGILTKAGNAKTKNKNAEAEEQVKLAVMGSYGEDGKINLETLKKNLTNQGISYEDSDDFPLKVKLNGVEVTVNEDGSIKEPFNAEEWDKTATPEDCFIWGSNIKGEDGYDVIIGYTEKLQAYSKVRIPSRCKKIICDGSYYSNNQYSDNQIGRAFFSNIEKIELPNTVVEIGDYAFGDIGLRFNNLLEEIIVPNSVSRIGLWAFAWCGNLKEITIPSSVNDMGREVFMGFSSSQTINIKENTDKPDGWSEDWNYGCNANLIWGYTGN